MGPSTLRRECLPLEGRSSSSFVTVTVNDVPAGHAFSCRWKYGQRQVCWVTQLVVHRDYRRRRLATGLLSTLRCDGDDIFGIMSSHPGACIAAAKAFAGELDELWRLLFAPPVS